MRKYILSIFLFINSIFVGTAQNNADAERLIDNFIHTVQSEAIRTDFRVIISEKNAVNSQQISGTLILKDKRFYLETDEIQVWFDGKTQWAYMKDDNEVSITEPTDEELAETNPVSILTTFKKASKIQFSKTKNHANYVVEMIPKGKNATFSRVEVQLVKASGNLFSIHIDQKNGSKNKFMLTNYQRKALINQCTFTFDKTKFKGLVINDLR